MAVAEPSAAELPRRLCAACHAVLPVDGVGLSLMARDQPNGRMLLGASDALGAQIEELQFSLGEGPCVSAFADAMRKYVEQEIGGSRWISPALHKRRAKLWRRIKWAVSAFLVTTMDYTVTRRLNFRAER